MTRSLRGLSLHETSIFSAAFTLLLLFNRLETFDYEPAVAWLPEKMHLELYPGVEQSSTGLTPLPAKLYSALLLKPKNDTHLPNGVKSLKAETIADAGNVDVIIPVSQYKSEILKLISLPHDRDGRAVSVNGSRYRLSMVALEGSNVWRF